MANTLKFGAGEWAVKEGSALAYNSENGNFKPLPFNFERDTTATRVNKEGLIEVVSNNEPRIDYKDDSKGALLLEPQRTNLINYSSDFGNSYWTKSGASIEGDPSTAGSELVVNGDFATDSDWTKVTGWTISGGVASFNTTNNQNLSQSGSYVGGKTYKVLIDVVSYTRGNPFISIGQGSIVNIPTTTGSHIIYVVSGGTDTLLRVYSGAAGVGGQGSIDNVSVKEVQGFTSPSGDTNAFKLVEDSANSQHYLQRNFTSTNGSSYTYKIYVKMNGRRNISLRENGSTGYYVSFDLLNGVILEQSNATGTIKELTNGWFEITHTSVAGNSFNVAYYLLSDSYTSGNPQTSPYQGDGVSGIYIYGAQVEQGSYATSYIPTQGAAVTRVAESCEQTPPDGIIGQTEGTLYAEIDFKSKPEAGSPIVGIIALNNNVSNLQNCIILGIERQSGGTNRFYPFVQVGNSTVAYIIGGTLTDGVYKAAFAYKENDFVLYVNGVQIGTDTLGAVPATSQVLVGERYNNDSVKIADSIKETKLYNTRLSNAELQALTTL